MLEGGGLHPKAGSTAHRPREGQGRGGGEQALEGLEKESRHGGTPLTKSNTETHTRTSLGARQEVVTEYLLGKAGGAGTGHQPTSPARPS